MTLNHNKMQQQDKIKSPEEFLSRGEGNFYNCTDYDDAVKAIKDYHAQFDVVKLKKELANYKRLFELCKKFKTDAENKAFENHAAKVSLDSEREMNAILTEETEKLKAEKDLLKSEPDSLFFKNMESAVDAHNKFYNHPTAISDEDIEKEAVDFGTWLGENYYLDSVGFYHNDYQNHIYYSIQELYREYILK